MEKQKKSRRAFFDVINKRNAQEETEIVKMLTPDGELVEVKRQRKKEKKSGQNTSNKDILNWMKNKK